MLNISLFGNVQLMDADRIKTTVCLVVEQLADLRSSNCPEFAVVIENSDSSVVPRYTIDSIVICVHSGSIDRKIVKLSKIVVV
jgi:hypothetical protein